ncbi:MAG: hypothetical protein COA99_05290 [Moraxellaceae bacterium]|nr:MAG: hypothetical protein COA99_05290 [Moraxellaceae bacterium]
MSLLSHAFSTKESWNTLWNRPEQGHKVIDGIRALSISLVILFHTTGMSIFMGGGPHLISEMVDKTSIYYAWIWNSHYAVDMFFMISGFLIAGLLFREIDRTGTIDLKAFYIRRLMRLTPAYLFVLTLLFIAKAPHYEMLWSNLLYVNNFFPYMDTAITWAWSLAVEEQFYFIFPILLLTVFIKSRFVMWMAGLLIFACLIRFFIASGDPILSTMPISAIMHDSEVQNHFMSVIYDNLYTRFGAFICGITVAYFLHYRKESTIDFLNNSHLGKATVVLAIVAAFMVFNLNSGRSDIDWGYWPTMLYLACARNLFCLSFSVVMLAMLVSHPLTRPLEKLLSANFWYPLAQLSYSSYLYNGISVGIVCFAMKQGMLHFTGSYDYTSVGMVLVSFCFAVPATMALSSISYLFIEQPFMRMRDYNRQVSKDKALGGNNASAELPAK